VLLLLLLSPSPVAVACRRRFLRIAELNCFQSIFQIENELSGQMAGIAAQLADLTSNMQRISAKMTIMEGDIRDIKIGNILVRFDN